MSGIHPAAARGFEAVADAYERGRPGYPAAAVAHLIEVLRIVPGATVLDLGAGTGKLTALLEPTGADVVAVEPVDAMRSTLERRVPRARALAGAAEAIPLEDGSVDAATVAQAFHWFDGDRALTELARVLRPDGRLGLVWNVRDQSVDWVATITRILDPYAGDAPRHRSGRWREAFDRTSAFGPLRVERFPFAHRTTPDGLVDRVLSTSFIGALEPEERALVRDRVLELTRTHPQLAGRGRFDFPYVTEVWWCERARR
ncbi:MAG: class I SAM-dependent methyltransferase [Candidatus Velamenicoccus archaeovorus]